MTEPVGRNYAYVLNSALVDSGYTLCQVEHRTAKEFRPNILRINDKTDAIDARVLACLGFHHASHPGLGIARPLRWSVTDSLFRTLSRDRWFIQRDLIRRRQQLDQVLAVTNPNLKAVFAKPTRKSILRFVQMYPSVADITAASESELYEALRSARAGAVARQGAQKLKELCDDTFVFRHPEMLLRQEWLVDETLRSYATLESLDAQITILLHGDPKRGIPAHPYAGILYSLPFMSDVWACTLIGVIGNIERFSTVRQFKEYLGWAPQTARSGTSLNRNKLTSGGVRDARRVLYQMTMLMINPRMRSTVFRSHYERLVGGRDEMNLPPMNKKKAMGHVAGKIAQVIYACLKNQMPYDPERHNRESV